MSDLPATVPVICQQPVDGQRRKLGSKPISPYCPGEPICALNVPVGPSSLRPVIVSAPFTARHHGNFVASVFKTGSQEAGSPESVGRRTQSTLLPYQPRT